MSWTTVRDIPPGERERFAFNPLFYRCWISRKSGFVRIVPRAYWFHMNLTKEYRDILGPHLDPWR